MTSLLFLLALLGYPESPVEFLDHLCENRSGFEGAIYWSDMAASSVDTLLSDPDSLEVQLSLKMDLSVEPGMRTLFETTDSGYIVEYGESVWTWTADDGRLHRLTGVTAIEWTAIGYRWTRLPFLASSGSGSVSVGRKERLVSAVLFTILILVFGAIALAWVKRGFQV